MDAQFYKDKSCTTIIRIVGNTVTKAIYRQYKDFKTYAIDTNVLNYGDLEKIKQHYPVKTNAFWFNVMIDKIKLAIEEEKAIYQSEPVS